MSADTFGKIASDSPAKLQKRGSARRVMAAGRAGDDGDGDARVDVTDVDPDAGEETTDEAAVAGCGG
jgi:hypothetical protein